MGFGAAARFLPFRSPKHLEVCENVSMRWAGSRLERSTRIGHCAKRSRRLHRQRDDLGLGSRSCVTSIQRVVCVENFHVGRRDQFPVVDGHLVERAVEVGLPEIEKAFQAREAGVEIVILPDVAL